MRTRLSATTKTITNAKPIVELVSQFEFESQRKAPIQERSHIPRDYIRLLPDDDRIP
jgi:hypothetical protein